MICVSADSSANKSIQWNKKNLWKINKKWKLDQVIFFFFAIESSLKIFFYLTHTAHVLKRGLCDVTQVEENVFEVSFELCFMPANCTNQILLISLMRMKNSQQMEFFRQVKCAWCESYGHWWRHHLSSLILHNCVVSMENHQEFNFKLLLITYILHRCNTVTGILEGNTCTVCCLSLF